MIYENALDNIEFLEEYKNITHQSILLNTITDCTFSGAILPSDNDYYLVASSSKDWTILSTLVKSFVGLSFSDFTGMKRAVEGNSKVEQYLLSKEFSFISKVSISHNRSEAQNSFENLYILYKQSPNKQMELPEHIRNIMERFKEKLRYQDINSAKSIISQIKKEHRIDALNLKFMEVELAHTSKDWDLIVFDKQIIQLVNSRKPLRIRLHIIEAFFYTYLDGNITEKVYLKKIRPMLLTLLSNCPSNVPDSIKSVYLWAYLQDDISYKHIKNIDYFIENNIYLSTELKSKLRAKIQETKELKFTTHKDGYLSTKASIVNANNIDTIESIEEVQEKLKEVEEKDILLKESIHSDILKVDTLPKNWLEWINLISIKSFREASSLAEHGLEEWSIDFQIRDPLDVEELSDAIIGIGEDFAIERFISTLPLFIEAFSRSQHYPNPMLQQMYISVLEFITIFEIQDQKTLSSSQNIVETLLLTSPNEEQYRAILENIESIIERTNGKNLVNWLLDYAELFISYNASDEEARDSIIQTILQRVYGHKDWLESYQVDLLLKLASSINLAELYDSLQEKKIEEVEDRWEKYENKTIGIYTLSENAGKEAKRRLEEYIKNIKVILNHDKASTTALKSMVEASDYVVLVTQSAKHAASGTIQKILRQRGDDPLFPIGKGSSSIIASLL
ncbi:MAG TPA: hypothetical protein EYG90_02365 [Campylobacterales bacterium]|nr:hypothetical protein [Campylobacterales bacterium]